MLPDPLAAGDKVWSVLSGPTEVILFFGIVLLITAVAGLVTANLRQQGSFAEERKVMIAALAVAQEKRVSDAQESNKTIVAVLQANTQSNLATQGAIDRLRDAVERAEQRQPGRA